MTTLDSLQPPLITITPGGHIDFVWSWNLLTLASKSLVAQRVGERFVEESGAEYRVDAARIVGCATGSLFERIVTFLDPAVDLDLTLVPTGRVVPVDELKRLLLKSRDLLHNVSSGWGSTAPFRREVELARDVPALFAVLKHYLPSPPTDSGRGRTA